MFTLNKIKYLLTLLWLLPITAKAQSGIIPNNPDPQSLPGNRNTIITDAVTDIITNILLPIAGIIAVLFIIIGGFQYMTSAGNDEQSEKGKKTLQNGIIGLVIIILSYVIVVVIANALAP